MIDKNELYKTLQTVYEDIGCPCTYDRQKDCLLIQIDDGPILLSVQHDGDALVRLELHMGLHLRTSAVPWHLLNRLNLEPMGCRAVISGCNLKNSPFGEVLFIYDVFDEGEGFVDYVLEACDMMIQVYRYCFHAIRHIRDVSRILEGVSAD